MCRRYLYLVTPVHLDNVEDVRLFVAESEEQCIEEVAKIESVNELFRNEYELIKGDYYQLALREIKNGEWMKLKIERLCEVELDGTEEFAVLH
ncbi:hypothetical protein [Halalkalibacter okhensis]|uniref:Uncharacterized protein n=1 Tax=Halalkalibacter okhensis TaxID=333138 RepID=A0A0B0IHE3_9BACI|nr:hypothetical protein [Halalkalibacter okhensis]KHF40720.1 hypothetical protein LQ50_08000 [Halalkalibacter okhensis]